MGCVMGAHEGRVGWGVVSTGGIAEKFSRDLALVSDDAALVAVSSRSADRAQAFADEHGFARAYGSVAELAADPEVDVIYVASIHNDHLNAARTCLEAGKSVLVEKPLTLNAAESTELIEVARRSGQFLMEAVWTRVHPLIRQAVEIAASGELGEIRHVSAGFGFRFDGPDTHRLLDPAQGGGTILDMGVYPLHAVNLFLGESADLFGYASLARTGVDGHATALLNYPATAGRATATASVISTLEVALARCPRGLRHSRTDHDHRILPTARTDDDLPRRRRARGAAGRMAGRGLLLRIPGSDAVLPRRPAAVTSGAVGRHAGGRPDAGRVASNDCGRPTGAFMIARLTGVIQPYAWGSATMIPELLGLEPSGEPQAELWLGAHPLAPSMIEGRPLDELLATDPRTLVGDAAVDAFGPRLPFLFKIIAADRPLSLQAHPTREQAEAGFAREQAAGVPRDAAHRIYRDGWPKPEVLCALQSRPKRSAASAIRARRTRCSSGSASRARSSWSTT